MCDRHTDEYMHTCPYQEPGAKYGIVQTPVGYKMLGYFPPPRWTAGDVGFCRQKNVAGSVAEATWSRWLLVAPGAGGGFLGVAAVGSLLPRLLDHARAEVPGPRGSVLWFGGVLPGGAFLCLFL